MSRYTIADLREDIKTLNARLLASGSNCFFREQGRNGYQAVDLYCIDESGRSVCMENIECGSSRECAQTMRARFASLQSKIAYSHRGGSISRRAAYVLLSRAVDFSADYHSLKYECADLLDTFAKITKYRKPAAANGSRARYFFAHLQRKYHNK